MVLNFSNKHAPVQAFQKNRIWSIKKGYLWDWYHSFKQNPGRCCNSRVNDLEARAIYIISLSKLQKLTYIFRVLDSNTPKLLYMVRQHMYICLIRGIDMAGFEDWKEHTIKNLTIGFTMEIITTTFVEIIK